MWRAWLSGVGAEGATIESDMVAQAIRRSRLGYFNCAEDGINRIFAFIAD